MYRAILLHIYANTCMQCIPVIQAAIVQRQIMLWFTIFSPSTGCTSGFQLRNNINKQTHKVKVKTDIRGNAKYRDEIMRDTETRCVPRAAVYCTYTWSQIFRRKSEQQTVCSLGHERPPTSQACCWWPRCGPAPPTPSCHCAPLLAALADTHTVPVKAHTRTVNISFFLTQWWHYEVCPPVPQ